MSLFRTEAIENKRSRLHGDVRLDVPLKSKIFVYTTLLFSILILAIMLLWNIPKRETVRGWIIPNNGIVKITTSNAGYVDQLFVAEGTEIDKGEQLFRLSANTLSAETQSATSLYKEEIEVKLAILAAKESSFLKEISNLKVKYSREKDSLSATIEKLKELLASSKESLRQAKNLHAKFEDLNSSEAASALEVITQRERVSDREQNVLRLELEIQEATGRLSVLEVTLNERVMQIRSQILELAIQRSDLKTQLTEVSIKQEPIQISPINGIVSDIRKKVGENAVTGDIIMAIIPNSNQLEAELLVPTRAAGNLKVDQHVRLKIDGFPHYKFGVMEGKITNISKTLLNPDQTPIDLGVEEPTFLVRVSCNGNALHSGEQKFIIQPGMTLNADIMQESLSFWESLRK